MDQSQKKEKEPVQPGVKNVTPVGRKAISRFVVGRSGKKQPTTSTNNEVTEGEAMSVRALAGIMSTMATVRKAIDEANGIKVPHMLYDQLR